MTDLRATTPPPKVSREESPFGGYRVVYDWEAGKCGATVVVDHAGDPVYVVTLPAGGNITGTGISESFWLAMGEAGIVRGAL